MADTAKENGLLRRFTGFWRATDGTLFLLCLAATVYSTLLVYSASVSAGSSGWLTQLIASGLGLLIALGMSLIDYEHLLTLWPVWAGGALLLVALTFTPLGLNVSGTDDTAWLAFPLGAGRYLTFQPAELLKVAFIITFSLHLSRVHDRIDRPGVLLPLMLHGLFPAGLAFLQGDDGTALVFGLLFVGMLFVAGLRKLYFLLGGIGIGALLPVVWHFMSDDKRARLYCLFQIDEYAATEGWQQYNALISIGRGQLWGVGYLNSAGNLLYARNNDFILTVAGEEFGFIGTMILLVILGWIILRMWRDSVGARDAAGTYLCAGVMLMIAIQSVLNIGMNLRLLPVVGITLPFFSAGGSSVITLYLAVGLVLSVRRSGSNSRNALFR